MITGVGQKLASAAGKPGHDESENIHEAKDNQH